MVALETIFLVDESVVELELTAVSVKLLPVNVTPPLAVYVPVPENCV